MRLSQRRPVALIIFEFATLARSSKQNRPMRSLVTGSPAGPDRLAFKCALLVTALAAQSLRADAQPPETTQFLREVLGYTNADLRDVAQGRPAVRGLDTTDGREIAIVGAIRVPISAAQYVERLRDIVAFKRHEAVRQIGTFGGAPRADDMAGLTLDADHLDDLRGCRPSHCDLQLSRAAIERVRAIQWSQPNAAAEANRVIRGLLAELTANYRQSGDAALMTYENDRAPLSVADEFRAMMAAPPRILPRLPQLEQHMTRFPSEAVRGIEDIFYWSKEDVGPKVIISVTHMAIVRVSDGPVAYAAASKQLYGSHYFDSSLGLTLLLEDEQPSSTVLVYLNRSRVDVLSGFLGGLKRAIVRSRARSAMADTLTRIKVRLPKAN
jgi:hypothetical protein